MTSLLPFVPTGRMGGRNVSAECSMIAHIAIIPGSILKRKKAKHEF